MTKVTLKIKRAELETMKAVCENAMPDEIRNLTDFIENSILGELYIKISEKALHMKQQYQLRLTWAQAGVILKAQLEVELPGPYEKACMHVICGDIMQQIINYKHAYNNGQERS